MAKQRSINTKMWSDSFFEKLDPSEKLLFVYLLTNMYTNICGIYEIPLKIVAVETGLDKEMVIKILNRFEKDNKILHIDGYICIVNFIKNQSNNPSVIKGIERELKEISKEVLQKISLQAGPTFTDCIQDVGLNLTKLNLTKPTEKQSEVKTEEKQKPSIKKIIDDMLSLGEIPAEYQPHLEAFINYWSETDKKGNEKRTKEKTRNVIGRLSRWNRNAVTNFGKKSIFAPDYEKLDQFDKQMSIDVQPIKDYFSKKYGPEWQVKYSETKQLWKQSPLYLKN